MQVLLERSVQSGSTQDHGIAFTELNKHVEDPLNTFGSAQSIDTVLDHPLAMASAEHLHVPLSMLDQEIDLSRYGPDVPPFQICVSSTLSHDT